MLKGLGGHSGQQTRIGWICEIKRMPEVAPKLARFRSDALIWTDLVFS